MLDDKQKESLRALVPAITKDISWFLEKVVEKRISLWVEEAINAADKVEVKDLTKSLK